MIGKLGLLSKIEVLLTEQQIKALLLKAVADEIDYTTAEGDVAFTISSKGDQRDQTYYVHSAVVSLEREPRQR